MTWTYPGLSDVVASPMFHCVVSRLMRSYVEIVLDDVQNSWQILGS